MGESTDQIKREIAIQRDDLGNKLTELETKAKSLTDWRGYFEKSPMTMIGVAFGGGLLLATIAGGKRRRPRNYAAIQSESSMPRTPTKTEQTFENVKSALFGIASTKAVEFLDEVVPGFGEHFNKRQTEHPPVSM